MYRILLVDDHAIVREGIHSILKRDLTHPILCDEAATTQEAERKLAIEKYDLVLLDVSMPGMSGLDFLTKLHREQPALQVLVISMHSEEQYAMTALSLGAVGYLTKESAPAELVLAVNKILGGGRYISSSFADQLAEHVFSGKKASFPHEVLSKREYQVLLKIGAGKTPKQIAYDLSISDKTVSTYRARVLEKLGMSNTAEMMKYAIKHLLN